MNELLLAQEPNQLEPAEVIEQIPNDAASVPAAITPNVSGSTILIGIVAVVIGLGLISFARKQG